MRKTNRKECTSMKKTGKWIQTWGKATIGIGVIISFITCIYLSANGIPPLQAFISFVVSAFLCAVGGIMIIGTGELIEDTNQIKCMLMDWMEKQNLMTEQNHHEQGVYNDKVEYYRNYRSRR